LAPRPLNFRQLEAFRAVMLTGSMTGAGHAMSISQPAVSRLIHDLEHELKLVLFQRQGVQIIATEAAVRLYSEVERHFSGADRIREAARAIRLSTAGYLHVGTMPNLAPHCLPEAIGLLLQDHPDVVVSVHPDSSINLVSMLLHAQLDIVFGTMPPDPDGLEHDPFPSTQAVCVMPAAHPLARKKRITVNDLDGQDFVALGQASRQRMQLNNAMLAAGVRPNIRVETMHSSSAIGYVSRGIGIAVIDPIAVIGHRTPTVAIRPFTPAISLDFSAVYRRNVPRPDAAAALTRALRRVVDDKLGELGARSPRTGKD